MHILIVNCAPLAMNEAVAASGGRSNDALFREALTRQDARVTAFTLNTADRERLPQGMTLDDFDGAVISGSPLSVYEDKPEVHEQLALARDLFERGVPTFGSCYGLQLMAEALGGRVHLNPRGREIGIARAIIKSDAGRAHPLLAEKPIAFDAICSHQDEVAELPEGGIVLASNAVSQIQAAVIERGTSSFWGVQYHPEFDLPTIAAIIDRQSTRHVAEGLARGASEVASIVADLHTVAADPARTDIAWRMGLTSGVLNPTLRTAEFGNWLRSKVSPFAQTRAEARASTAAAPVAVAVL